MAPVVPMAAYVDATRGGEGMQDRGNLNEEKRRELDEDLKERARGRAADRGAASGRRGHWPAIKRQRTALMTVQSS